jgi:hypothetical protein
MEVFMKINRKKAKGTVLYTVVSVMIVLFVFVMVTLSLAKAANDRAHNSYNKNQAQYTAENIVDVIQNALVNTSSSLNAPLIDKIKKAGDKDIALSVSDLPEGSGTLVDPRNHNTENPVVLLEYCGQDAPGQNFIQGSNKAIYKVSVSVKRGKQIYDYSQYLYQTFTPDEESLISPPALTTNGEDSAASNMSLNGGGKIMSLNHAAAVMNKFPGTDAEPHQFLDKFWDPSISSTRPVTNFEIEEHLSGDADYLYNTDIILKTALDLTLAPNHYFVCMGDLTAGSAQRIDIKTDFDYSSMFNMPVLYVNNLFDFYVHADSKIQNVNFVCGSFNYNNNTSVNTTFVREHSVFAFDSTKTSTFGNDSSTFVPLMKWTEDVLDRKGNWEDYEKGGNFYTAGNLNVKVKGNTDTEGINIQGDLIVEGDLTVTAAGSSKLTVGGDLIVKGTYTGSDNVKVNGYFYNTGNSENTMNETAADVKIDSYQKYVFDVRTDVVELADKCLSTYLPSLTPVAAERFPSYSGAQLFESQYDPFSEGLEKIGFGVAAFPIVTGEDIQKQITTVDSKGNIVIEKDSNVINYKLFKEKTLSSGEKAYGLTLYGDYTWNNGLGQPKKIEIDPDTGTGASKAVIINLVDFKCSIDDFYFSVKAGSEKKVYFYIPGNTTDDIAIFSNIGITSIVGDCKFNKSPFIQDEYVDSTGKFLKPGITITSDQSNAANPADRHYQVKTMVVMNGTGTLSIEDVLLRPVIANMLLPYAVLKYSGSGGGGELSYANDTETPQTITKIATIGCILVREFQSGPSNFAVAYLKFLFDNSSDAGGYQTLKDDAGKNLLTKVYEDGTVVEPKLVAAGTKDGMVSAPGTPEYYAELKALYNGAETIIEQNPSTLKWYPLLADYPTQKIPSTKEVIWYEPGTFPSGSVDKAYYDDAGNKIDIYYDPDDSTNPIGMTIGGILQPFDESKLYLRGTGYYDDYSDPVTIFFNAKTGSAEIFYVNGALNPFYTSGTPLYKSIADIGTGTLAVLEPDPDTPSALVAPNVINEIPVYLLDSVGNPVRTTENETDSVKKTYRKDSDGKLLLDYENLPIEVLTEGDYEWAKVAR